MTSLFSSTLNLRAGVKITDEEFVDLRDFVYEVSGIFVDDRRKYLFENRLGGRLHELRLKNFGEYLQYLRFDSHGKAELDKLLEKVTTNETSFFRDMDQLNAFKDKVLPPIIEARKKAGNKELNIWSAGCSSGEEPYTLAMILHELMGPLINSWRIRITANDLSPRMIKTAKAAEYGEHALRTTPPKMLSKYFTANGSSWKVNPKIASLVSFGRINLSDKAQLARVPKSQIIFCRNVIIYFDKDMKKKVASAFYDNLQSGGYLVLGHSESLHGISSSFMPERHPGAIVYKRLEES